jgi:hypothetical protein
VRKELIRFYRDRNIPFQSLNFVRLHGAPELFDQGAAPVSEFAWARFRHPEPVIRRKTILFNAIALEMCQPNDELSCDGAVFGGFEVGFYGVANLSSEWYPGPTRCRGVAFLEQQEKQFKSVRDPELVEDPKQVVFNGVLAKPELVGDLLVALALRSALSHLKFPMRKQIYLAALDTLAGWCVSESLEQKLRMVPSGPNLTPADMLDTSRKFR